MFTAFVAVSFAALAVAAPWDTPASQQQCTTGALQCCDTISASNSPSAQTLLGSLGIPIAGLTGQVGANCVPVTVIGTGSGADCSQQPVCCTNNNYNGLVALGCTPIGVDA